MGTTPTSKNSSAVLSGLFDELETISIAEQPTRKEQIKKWLKSTALITAGAGAGTAAGMLINKGLEKGMQSAPWRGLSPATRAKVLGALVGGGTMASTLLAKKLIEERNK